MQTRLDNNATYNKAYRISANVNKMKSCKNDTNHGLETNSLLVESHIV